ncbi:MAG TPA: PrgI family protein [Butyrivibrio sp.]|nr:PrgI family protein [Butyrivibrio sp.]
MPPSHRGGELKGDKRMEFKINKEIRDYKEQFFLGFNARQTAFTVVIVIVALTLHFILRNKMSSDTRSWVIPTAVVPLFLIGFKSFKGMYLEKFIAAWFKQCFLMPKQLTLGNDDYIQEILKEEIHERKSKN